MTVYAGQRRECAIPADPISGTEMAWEISEAGGAPDRPPAEINSSETDGPLTGISGELAHLTSLVEPVEADR